ncbi:hypothetical protein BGZ88_006093, partial [Linnemannia elongata]
MAPAVDQPPSPLTRGKSVVSLYKSCLNLIERLRNSDPAKPTEIRAKVVNEILETERRVVQELENLQAYR